MITERLERLKQVKDLLAKARDLVGFSVEGETEECDVWDELHGCDGASARIKSALLQLWRAERKLKNAQETK